MWSFLVLKLFGVSVFWCVFLLLMLLLELFKTDTKMISLGDDDARELFMTQTLTESSYSENFG